MHEVTGSTPVTPTIPYDPIFARGTAQKRRRRHSAAGGRSHAGRAPARTPETPTRTGIPADVNDAAMWAGSADESKVATSENTCGTGSVRVRTFAGRAARPPPRPSGSGPPGGRRAQVKSAGVRPPMATGFPSFRPRSGFADLDSILTFSPNGPIPPHRRRPDRNPSLCSRLRTRVKVQSSPPRCS